MRLKYFLKLISFVTAILAANSVAAGELGIVNTDQGPDWSDSDRTDFYSQDQGSRIMPLSWLKALRQSNGEPFLSDSLGRYGYLRNLADSNGLPVGFTASGPQGSQFVGMTCAACHTRQIIVNGSEYRIDGAPAIVDFQRFLAEIDDAVGTILKDETEFNYFARAVLGQGDLEAAGAAALRLNLSAWYERYHTLMSRALPQAPDSPWGLGRLDAVGMIFNRITGLDLGSPPTYLISENIKRANAPVRYPFLWNAPKQDKTQWPGFADNGSDILGLSRNLGEVYGVFGVFEPKKEWWHVLGVNYLNNNSANFDGLSRLEKLVKKIGAPKWPWPIDKTLAEQGSSVFNRHTADGGCVDCHGISPGQVRFPGFKTWATPIQDVGTDTKSHEILSWTAKTGILQGAKIPFVTNTLNETDLAFNVLATSVAGAIVQNYSPLPATAQETQLQELQQFQLPSELRDLKGAFNLANAQNLGGELSTSAPLSAYESRVLEGIWATAPYLHNGSVPTLVELLKPASQRLAAFKVGPAYDQFNIGLAAEQPKLSETRLTTDCGDRNSGNSRCGHEFGTQLTPDDKRALLEYLKRL